jgi:hypothetical protein
MLTGFDVFEFDDEACGFHFAFVAYDFQIVKSNFLRKFIMQTQTSSNTAYE